MLHRLGVLTVVLLLVGVSGVAYAQGTATLRGEVSDNYGSVIPAADVIVTNNATGVGSDRLDGCRRRLRIDPGARSLHGDGGGFRLRGRQRQ